MRHRSHFEAAALPHALPPTPPSRANSLLYAARDPSAATSAPLPATHSTTKPACKTVGRLTTNRHSNLPAEHVLPAATGAAAARQRPARRPRARGAPRRRPRPTAGAQPYVPACCAPRGGPAGKSGAYFPSRGWIPPAALVSAAHVLTSRLRARATSCGQHCCRDFFSFFRTARGSAPGAPAVVDSALAGKRSLAFSSTKPPIFTFWERETETNGFLTCGGDVLAPSAQVDTGPPPWPVVSGPRLKILALRNGPFEKRALRVLNKVSTQGECIMTSRVCPANRHRLYRELNA